MENTGKVLFEDDSPQWYIAMGSRWVGPLAAADVYQKIHFGELTWAHYVWRSGQTDWKRICDVKMFQALVPGQPGRSVQQEVKEAAKPVVKQAGRRASGPTPPPAPTKKKAPPPAPEVERPWFLYYNDSQFGPFAQEEIDRFLRVGKIHGRVHVWRDGMANWERLETVTEFSDGVQASARARAAAKAPAPAPQPAGASHGKGKTSTIVRPFGAPSEQRRAPRRPLVAKILMAHEESVVVAVCRDISIGGMQVLTDRVPGVVGARIKMNVSPSASDDTMRIDPFVAEGLIVRILEDGRGFSFRFDRLTDASRRSIERYIEACE